MKQKKMIRIFNLVILGLFATNIWAAPDISSISGAFGHNQSISLFGTGFGSKSPAKPYLWAPFNESINPSQLGLTTFWSKVENMVFSSNEGFGGTGCAKGTAGSGIWTLGTEAKDFAWNDFNQKMYLFRKTKRNFNVTDDLNWKVWRVWGAGLTLPDFYLQTGNGNMSVEGIGVSGWMNTTIGRGPTNNYFTEEIVMKSNSDLNKSDAMFSFIVNGKEAGRFPYTDYSTKTLQLKSQSYQNPMNFNFPVHGVKANITFPSNYLYWADDVYLDNTWARVMIGNSSTWDGCTQKEPQIPSAWNSTNVAVTVNTGAFSTGQTVYLYVIDANGSVNSKGYPVTIGTSPSSGNPTTSPSPPAGVPPSAPTLNQPVMK